MIANDRIVAAEGTGNRIVACRLKPDTDLIKGIEQVCTEFGLTSGVILCVIGSLKEASFQYLVPMVSQKTGAGYEPPLRFQGPIEILYIGGNITTGEDGNVVVHLHGSVCDAAGKVMGGHFTSGGNPALFTVEVVLEEIVGAALLRKYDPAVDAPAFLPQDEKR